jgi:hypothetical protein
MSKTQLFMFAGESFQIKSATCYLLEMIMLMGSAKIDNTTESAMEKIHATVDFIQEALKSSGYSVEKDFIMRNLRLDEIGEITDALNTALGLVGKPTANL